MLPFFYFAPTASLVSIPLASVDAPFIFKEVTSDFQDVTIQGQVTYKIADPEKLSGMLNFALDAKGVGCISEDPQKLPQRVINRIQVLMRAQLQAMPLRQALQASDSLVANVLKLLTTSDDLQSLGIEILDCQFLQSSPTPKQPGH